MRANMGRRDGLLRCVIALTLATLVLASCGGGKKAKTPAPRQSNVASSKTFEPNALSGLVLAPADLPRGSGLKQVSVGSLSLEEFWGCCPKQRSIFEAAKFVAAYRVGYQVSNLPADVPQWKSGISFVNSAVALFVDARGASSALPAWLEFFSGSKIGDTTDIALATGDEAKGITGTFFKKDQQMYIYFWRIGNLILHIRIGGKNPTLKQADLENLVKTIDARAH